MSDRRILSVIPGAEPDVEDIPFREIDPSDERPGPRTEAHRPTEPKNGFFQKLIEGAKSTFRVMREYTSNYFSSERRDARRAQKREDAVFQASIDSQQAATRKTNAEAQLMESQARAAVWQARTPAIKATLKTVGIASVVGGVALVAKDPAMTAYDEYRRSQFSQEFLEIAKQNGIADIAVGREGSPLLCVFEAARQGYVNVKRDFDRTGNKDATAFKTAVQSAYRQNVADLSNPSSCASQFKAVYGITLEDSMKNMNPTDIETLNRILMVGRVAAGKGLDL